MTGTAAATTTSTDLLKLAEYKQFSGNSKSLAGDFSNIMGALINYNALKSDVAGLKIQADGVELAAKQKANQIREQFIQTAANYQYNAARRGLSVHSASVRSNLEGSAEAMGKDIQRLQQNASLEAGALRAKAKVALAYGKAERNRELTKSAVNIFSTAMSMGSGAGGGA